MKPCGWLFSTHWEQVLKSKHCEQSAPLVQGSTPSVVEVTTEEGPLNVVVLVTVVLGSTVDELVVDPPAPVGASTKTLPPQAPRQRAASAGAKKAMALMSISIPQEAV